MEEPVSNKLEESLTEAVPDETLCAFVGSYGVTPVGNLSLGMHLLIGDGTYV